MFSRKQSPRRRVKHEALEQMTNMLQLKLQVPQYCFLGHMIRARKATEKSPKDKSEVQKINQILKANIHVLN